MSIGGAANAPWRLLADRTASDMMLVRTEAVSVTASTDAELERLILADATAGNVTIALPPAFDAQGLVYSIKKTDASANTVIIDPDASETIDGAATMTILYQYSCATILSDGENWHVI